MNELDRVLQGLDQLQHRKVIREFSVLIACYIRARTSKKLIHTYHETRARMLICGLSAGARAVLEATLRSGE